MVFKSGIIPESPGDCFKNRFLSLTSKILNHNLPRPPGPSKVDVGCLRVLPSGRRGGLPSQQSTGVAVPLRVVPSPTGLPSKRGPGLGSFSRADRGIGGVRARRQARLPHSRSLLLPGREG